MTDPLRSAAPESVAGNEPNAIETLHKTEHKGVRPHVLVIDDDVEFLELAQIALGEMGLEVSVARTPGEGLVRAVKQPPDIILSAGMSWPSCLGSLWRWADAVAAACPSVLIRVLGLGGSSSLIIRRISS